MLPKKLKNFNLFTDGDNLVGIVDEITLPNLQRKFEEIRPGGFNAPVDTDMGMQKMEASFKLHEIAARILRQFGVATVDGVALRFLGAAVSDGGDASTDAIEVIMRGRYSGLELPSGYKAGESGMLGVTASLTYFKYVVNGETLIEIDIINMLERVNGEDRLAAQRAALGL
ncbi:MAG: phage major tail tube protein [Candidatus Reddybacter sp.]